METFKIEIQELLCRVEEVQAKSYEAALTMLTEQYKKAEIVLDYNDFAEVNFINVDKQSKADEITQLTKEVIGYLYKDEQKHFKELSEPEDHIFKKLERLRLLID